LVSLGRTMSVVVVLDSEGVLPFISLIYSEISISSTNIQALGSIEDLISSK